MAKKKRSRRHQGTVKKIAKTMAYGMADALILAPAAIPAIIFANEMVGGHTVRYSANTATQYIAGVSIDGGDSSVDWGKVTKYAVSSAGLVLLGLGMRKFVAKRI